MYIMRRLKSHLKQQIFGSTENLAQKPIYLVKLFIIFDAISLDKLRGGQYI